MPKFYIACMDPPFAAAAAARERAKTGSGWDYIEIATGHDAMVTAPELLARTLLDIAVATG
ncbi:hypothetical protein MWN33_07515 [Starkeya koreensis]|uniref:Alpha/beta hydrolase family protein n=1 Tax=Ancylobacter koreensis TaxID=266121 RepID=A0ABT0DKS7_9HYPH|nr:hypothetical protein [Ancylobacter koreensis]MCK0207880.1 hypothetical protein [Ancylobacter koreensis]